MKKIKQYIHLLSIIGVYYLLVHSHVFFSPFWASKVYICTVVALPTILMFMFFRFSNQISESKKNVAMNILFNVFLGDVAFFNSRAILMHLGILEYAGDFFSVYYYPFLFIIAISVAVLYVYRNKLDFNRLKSDSYDKLGCYVVAKYPKKWYEFLWSLIYGIPVSSFGILMNGYVYEYDKNTKKLKDRYKVQDITQYKLKRVKVNKDSLKSRLNGYEGKFSLFTNNCRFIKDIMGRTVQFYYK